MYVFTHVSLGTPPAATVVIVMCIAALVVIVVLGIYRIHTTHQDGSKEDEEGRKDPEMDWDNSNLNITVNPMEVSMCIIGKDNCWGNYFETLGCEFLMNRMNELESLKHNISFEQ